MPIPVTLPASSPWRTQLLVLYGLFIRECKTRLGRLRLGIVWILAEPLASVTVLSIVFGVFLERAVPAIPYPMFLLAGFLPYGLFSKLITRNISCLRSNQGLMVYSQVKPLDPMLARVILEVVIFVVAVGLFTFIASWFFDAAPDFHRPLRLFAGTVCLVLIGTGLGIFFAVLCWRFQDLEKLIPLLLHPIFFLSCVIYPLHLVPMNYRWFFVWNPLVVIIENMRVSLYPHYRTEHMPLMYPLTVGVIFVWLGMAFYYANREKLHDGSLA